MRGRVYRGTALARAREEEFGTGAVHGREIEIISGFMDPDDADEDWSGEFVEDLPWEMGPEVDQQYVVGGLSDRLGPAASFASGAVPVVMHYDGSELPNLTRVQYSYDDYDRAEGMLPWVDGTATGELRVIGDLEGLVNKNEGQRAISYYGEGLRSITHRYNDEMEWVVTGQERLDVSDATTAAVDPRR